MVVPDRFHCILIHHINFRLYLYFLNIVLYIFKYSCTNIFHRHSLYTFYQYKNMPYYQYRNSHHKDKMVSLHDWLGLVNELFGPWEMLQYFLICNFQTLCREQYIEEFLCVCPQTNARGLIDDNSTLVELMACCLTAPSHYLNQLANICHHMASLDHNELIWFVFMHIYLKSVDVWQCSVRLHFTHLAWSYGPYT